MPYCCNVHLKSSFIMLFDNPRKHINASSAEYQAIALSAKLSIEFILCYDTLVSAP